MLHQNISSFCTLSTLSGTSTLSLFRRPWKLLSLKVWLLENGNRNSLPHPHTPKEQPPGWWTHRVSQTPAAFLLSETLPKHPVANILNHRLLKCIAFGYFKRILVVVVYTSLQRTGNPFLQKNKKKRCSEEVFTEGSTQFPSEVTHDFNLSSYHTSAVHV